LASDTSEQSNISEAAAALDVLRRRLRRLGVVRGDEFVPQPPPPSRDIDQVVEGQVQETAAGPCYVVERSFAAEVERGPSPISVWLRLNPATIAQVGGNADLAISSLQKYIFLDTETTGLGGGALAFMVGVGRFNDRGGFDIHQFFLRHPAEEQAMLMLVNAYLPPDGALVTFNGRSFDVPLLSGRSRLARLPDIASRLPNLDLLLPARRLWRRRLPSCALGSLEANILNLRRDQADVPGYLIPTMYQHYLRTGDAGNMAGIFYHNQEDLVSMAALGIVLCRVFERPDQPGLPIDDRLSLAHWYQKQDRLEEAEAAYGMAVEEAPDAASRYDALVGLSFLLKRLDRREEAVPLWVDMADLRCDTTGQEELAKYYEWHSINLHQALEWTNQAIALVESWRPGFRRTEILRTFEHRRARLLRKIRGDENA
jgi:uncharacterized protein YprB with RNaseH-like and TPR domain